MLRPRIIPCLLVHEGGLVKTVQFAAPRYVGDPINAVKIFNEKEADELIVLDIDATVARAEPNFRLIAQFAAECRMPLCYGGGVKTVEHAKRITALGVEKVGLSSAAIANPQLISQIAQEIGSQSVIVVLDVRERPGGDGYDVWTHNGRTKAPGDVIAHAREAAARGAGEIVINSIDNDGRGAGYDLALAAAVRRTVRLPITVLGGAGTLEHMEQLIRECGIVGAAAGSLFVFKGPYRAVLINYPSRVQKERLTEAAASRVGQ